MDSAFALIMARTVHHHAVDPGAVERTFKAQLEEARSGEDSVQAIVAVFAALGDVHSQFIVGDRTYAHYVGVDDSLYARLRPMLALAAERTNAIRVQRLDSDVIYVQLPAIQAWGEQINVFAQMIRDPVIGAWDAGVRGCILDLRLNTDRQVASMLAGLRALLGDGPLGSAVDADGQVIAQLALVEGHFTMNVYPIATVQGTDPDLSGLPVAVLIGPLTASSGTLTAIAFKGRPATRFFGEPTAAGYSTGNDFFPLPPLSDGRSVALNLSTAINRDRNGVAYPESVQPDEPVQGGEQFTAPLLDGQVRQALRWLREDRR